VALGGDDGADGYLRSFKSVGEPGCQTESSCRDRRCRAAGRVSPVPGAGLAQAGCRARVACRTPRRSDSISKRWRSQRDTDARWTRKHGKSRYGYKNHGNVDSKHKLVHRYHVSDAALHDSQAVNRLMTQDNTGGGVWADPAYRSEDMIAKLRDMKLERHIHRKGKRGKLLTEQGKGNNQTTSAVRARVRAIGMVRAKAKIGMKNLADNMRRLGQLSLRYPMPAGGGIHRISSVRQAMQVSTSQTVSVDGKLARRLIRID